MKQIEWVYEQLHALSQETLIKIIDELGLNQLTESDYKEMQADVYKKAKQGYELSHKQKRVLVNIIGQPRI